MARKKSYEDIEHQKVRLEILAMKQGHGILSPRMKKIHEIANRYQTNIIKNSKTAQSALRTLVNNSTLSPEGRLAADKLMNTKFARSTYMGLSAG